MPHHQDACQSLGKGIDTAIGHPFAGQKVIVQEHCRKALDILQFEQRENDHTQGDETFDDRHKSQPVASSYLYGDRESRSNRKHGEHRAIGWFVGIGYFEAEMAAQIIVPPDPFAIYEYLRCGGNALLLLEGIDFGARG